MILTADHLYPANHPVAALRAVTMVLTKNEERHDSSAELARELIAAGDGRRGQLPHLFVPPTTTHPRMAAPAYVNHGRWVVDCPGPGCREAQAATPDDPRFFCTSCRNAAADGHFVKVVWPDEAQRQEAERLLDRRAPQERNWLPWRETAADLAAGS